MSVSSAIKEVRKESGQLSQNLKLSLEDLDLDATSLLALRDKYNLIALDVVGLTYPQLVEKQALPPTDPSTFFDQTRAGLANITVLGSVFFPSLPIQGNLKAIQEFYLSNGENLGMITQRLQDNPPGVPSLNSFDLMVNRFEVLTSLTRNADGSLKTKAQVAKELTINNFEMFTFSQIPQILFIVSTDFLGANTKLSTLAAENLLDADQLSCRVIWFGAVNPTSSNLSKMKVTLELDNTQLRAASFGDDLASSSSGSFKKLLASMDSRFTFPEGIFPAQAGLVSIINNIEKDALSFLAKITFGTTVISDRNVLSDAKVAGVTDKELEVAFASREDLTFRGAKLTANSVLTTVFPKTDNVAARNTLGTALQQAPDTLKFTNNALNQEVNQRKFVVLAAKRLLAGVAAHKIIILRENVTEQDVTQALLGISIEISALRAAYDNFLAPPDRPPRRPGSPTTESLNHILSRACNLIASLGIKKQIEEFPLGPNQTLTENLKQVLSGLTGITLDIENYLKVYRHGSLRDFLAKVVSVSSMTRLFLSEGVPKNNLIISELTTNIAKFRKNIKNTILEDPETSELFSKVAAQTASLGSVVGDSREENLVGRLLDLPVLLLDSVLEESVIDTVFPLARRQKEALVQLRESFAVLKQIAGATSRDLSTYTLNFQCAMCDAEFLITRLAGDSVGQLATELRQS